jgi:hypothetical protein
MLRSRERGRRLNSCHQISGNIVARLGWGNAERRGDQLDALLAYGSVSAAPALSVPARDGGSLGEARGDPPPKTTTAYS